MFRWKIWGLTTFFLASLISSLILTNTYDLRTLLYLDRKIHSWTNIQDGQIIQRSDRETSNLNLTGRVGLLAKSVDVAVITPDTPIINKDRYINLDKSPFLTDFKGNVSVFPGWIKIFGRSQRGNYHNSNGINIGVGEVFIVAGQSNASGSSKTLFMSQSSHVRCGQLQENDSIVWKQGDDPQILGGGGSPWPIVGDMLNEKLGLPIGFINVAIGGSSIRDWHPEKPYFRRLLKIIEASQPYGIRAILWHQGESDRAMTSDEYYNRLLEIIEKSQKLSQSQRQIPWLVSRASYFNGKISKSVRDAQKRLWDKNIAFPGPDTDVLQKEYREIDDGVHFNEIGTRQVAQMWFEKINDALFEVNPE